MGFLSWVRDRFDDAKEWISDKWNDAKEAVKDFFGLGRSASYDGSVSQTVNVERVLNNFKAELEEKIKEQEEHCIASALELFNELIEELKDDFYDSVVEAERKKVQVIEGLRGIMMDHARKRISENDPQFEAVLKMYPGNAKTEQLGKRTQEIASEAESLFYDKLKKEIELLNDELAQSLEESLEEQGSKIAFEKEQLEELNRSALNGTLDLQAFEVSTEPIAETAGYLLLLLSESK